MSSIIYEDFEIEVMPLTDERFSVRVDCPQGQGSGDFELSLSETELEEQLSDMTVHGTDARELGKRLFNTLFCSETVRDLYQRSIGRLSEHPELGLRIRLHIDPTDQQSADLSEIPWEYMYHSHDFLNLNRRTPIVRYLDVPRPYKLLPLQLPLRVLVVISNPNGLMALDWDEEKKLLEEHLGGREDIKLVFMEHPTPVILQRKLLDEQFHIFHYMGHGMVDRKTGDGILALEDASGGIEYLNGEELGMLLNDARTIRLAFLNACETMEAPDRKMLQTMGKKYNYFSNIANALMMKGILSVIGMQFPITDRAALTFAQSVYPLLARGEPIDYAVAEGRKAVRISLKSLEWGTPVLLMRVRDGRLFAMCQDEISVGADLSQETDTEAQQSLGAEQVLGEDRYQINKLLSWRAFMSVYQAYDTENKRDVLIRKLSTTGRVANNELPYLVKRLKNLESPKNPRIVEIYEVFVEKDNIYMVAEFMAGGTLENQLTLHKCVDLWDAMEIVDGICKSLEFIHQKGQIHGRIKPANIMFTANGKVKLENCSIFNFAEEIMQISVPLRTEDIAPLAFYMSPERVNGARDDPRMDIYAVGAILYQMLTGLHHLKFRTNIKSISDYIHNVELIHNSNVIEPSVYNPEIPDWIDKIVLTALAKDPAERYSTIRRLAKALQEGIGQDTLVDVAGKENARQKPRYPSKPVAEDIELQEHTYTDRSPEIWGKLITFAGREYILHIGDNSLGRSPNNTIFIADTKISRRHARIYCQENEAEIIDLGSINGTFVNGRRLQIKQPYPLKYGDEIRLGKQVRFRVHKHLTE